ncbi:MAG: sigma-70 family RNA polymerase sigma factor [Ginsengibacter sp.]
MNIYEQEKQLLEALVSNDRIAIEKIYRENFPTIQAFILKNNGYADDAKDIFQEAMIVLFQKAKLDSFVLTCQVKTFLYSVSRRLWLKKLQRENKYNDVTDNLKETVSVDDEIEAHEKQNAEMHLMEKALSKIGEPCKGILEAFYIEKKTMPEIAEAFDYTNADNAKTQKYKCLNRLKKIFFSQYKNGG